jgi:hypothetical protein
VLFGLFWFDPACSAGLESRTGLPSAQCDTLFQKRTLISGNWSAVFRRLQAASMCEVEGRLIVPLRGVCAS